MTGEVRQEEIMFCEKCGNELLPGDKFCERCGSPVDQSSSVLTVEDFNDDDSAESGGEKEPGKKKKKILAVIIVILLICVFAAVLFLTRGKNSGEDDAGAVSEESEETEGAAETEASPESEESANAEESEDTDKKEAAAGEEDTKSDADVLLPSPAVASVSATSALSEYGMTHEASRVVDGDLTTGWSEGAEGQGIGESITLTFEENSLVEGIIIYAGYQKSEELYQKNSRPKQITLTFSDGTELIYELEDVNDAQIISFADGIAAESITITIDSVYEGTAYEDTVITEICFE